MPTAAPASLRERKRLETWNALHDAAVGLALSRDALSEVTVEEIAELAEVSPRTFFNYFKGKEDAVLGLSEPVVAEPILAAFTQSDEDLLGRVARLFFAVAVNSFAPAGRLRRVELVQRYPELSQRQVTHLYRVEGVVTEVVAEHLADLPRWRAADRDHGVDEVAQMVVMVCGVATKVVARRMVRTPEPDEDLALERAISLLRQIIGKL